MNHQISHGIKLNNSIHTAEERKSSYTQHTQNERRREEKKTVTATALFLLKQLNYSMNERMSYLIQTHIITLDTERKQNEKKHV